MGGGESEWRIFPRPPDPSPPATSQSGSACVAGFVPSSGTLDASASISCAPIVFRFVLRFVRDGMWIGRRTIIDGEDEEVAETGPTTLL